MKYGVLYFEDTTNIGDDIQSCAAMRFLPRVDYLIDRETMHAFVSDEHEPVCAIMNAWYLFNKFNWPPSNDIYPLCLAMHLSAESGNTNVPYLTGLGADWLKHYAPVGARDAHTLKLLEGKGIAAYFSGCLTLTLQKRAAAKPERPYICLVDVPDNVRRHIKKTINTRDCDVVLKSHIVDYTALPPWTERVKNVEALLSLYQNARCVVTTRLHCALPCLAMGTPVLFICDTPGDTRLESYLPYLRHASSEQCVTGGMAYSFDAPPENTTDYLAVRHALEKTAYDFIDRLENGEQKISLFTMSGKERAKWQSACIQHALDSLFLLQYKELRAYLSACGLKKLLYILTIALRNFPKALYKAIRCRI